MSLFTKLRNLNKKVYIKLRRINLKKVVKKEKKDHMEKWVLTKAQKKLVKDFYSPYKKPSLLYHNFYTHRREEFCVDYLPDDIYYNYVDMFYNDHQSALIFDNKCFYSRLFPSVKHPGTIVYRRNGFWFDSEHNLISIDIVYEKVLSEQSCFIKRAVDCGGGVGVIYFESTNKRASDLEKIVQSIKEDLIIQKPIKQHKDLAALNSSCVNTIRTVSFLDKDNTVKIYVNLLRMGVDGCKVDNESSGGVSCNIDDNGKLCERAYIKKGTVFFKHPNSQIEFLGYQLPSIDKIQQTIKKLHLVIPQFRLVSWDFTIDEDGEPVFIECNMSSSGINIVQLAHGPLFGSDTQKILNEVFGKNR